MGRATAIASVHRTLAKSRLSNPPSKCPNAQKDQSERIGLFVSMGYEKDIFAVFAYEFELSHK